MIRNRIPCKNEKSFLQKGVSAFSLAMLALTPVAAFADGHEHTHDKSVYETSYKHQNIQADVADQIIVHDPVVRITTSTVKTAAFYGQIANISQKDDTLIGASTPLAAMIEIHETVDDDGVTKMQKISGIPVPAGGSADLTPGGLHVMLMGLTETLKAGDTVPLTLQFESLGKIMVEAVVKQAGQDSMEHDYSHH